MNADLLRLAAAIAVCFAAVGMFVGVHYQRKLFQANANLAKLLIEAIEAQRFALQETKELIEAIKNRNVYPIRRDDAAKH